MIMVLALLAADIHGDGLRTLARRIADNPALMHSIEAHAGPIVKCSRLAINRYLASKGEEGLKTPEDTLSAAIIEAGQKCVSRTDVVEVSEEIRSAMPDVDHASADAIATSMLSQYAAMAIMSDGD